MTVETVRAVAPRLGIAPTCAAVRLPTATYYCRLTARPAARRPSPRRKLSEAELTVLHDLQFIDLAAAGGVYAQLLDAEHYLRFERSDTRAILSTRGRFIADAVYCVLAARNRVTVAPIRQLTPHRRVIQAGCPERST